MIALVDTLNCFPESHPGRKRLATYLATLDVTIFESKEIKSKDSGSS